MKGIKTFRLFIANGCLLLKTFLMRLAIVLIFLSVPILLLNCSVSDFAEFIDKSVNAFSLLIEEMSGGKVYSVDGFAEVLRKAVFTVYDLFDSLFVNVPELFSKPVVIYVGIAVFYVLYRFFDGLFDFSTVSGLREFMAFGKPSSYLWGIYKNFGKFASYQFPYIFVTLVSDLFVFFAIVGAYLSVFVELKLAGLIITAVMALICFSFRMSLFSFWAVERIYSGEGLVISFRNSLKLIIDRFFPVFASTFITLFLCLATLVLLRLFVSNRIVSWALSFASILISFYELRCMNLVQYYEAIGKPYFTKKLDLVKKND